MRHSSKRLRFEPGDLICANEMMIRWEWSTREKLVQVDRGTIGLVVGAFLEMGHRWVEPCESIAVFTGDRIISVPDYELTLTSAWRLIQRQ
jgi:hypothetical protein